MTGSPSVLPAHNEEEHLGRALLSVQRAADALHRVRPDITVGVTVVLDSCTDGSAGIAAQYVAADRRFNALEVSLRNAGASRAAGIRAAGIWNSPAEAARQAVDTAAVGGTDVAGQHRR